MNKKLNFFQTRPKTQSMNVEGYLKRIGLFKQEPDLKYLRRLHRNHLLAIPFENLDIHYQRKIVLNIEKIYQKVIIRNRGGICYELNVLFFNLLNHLGFDAHLGSARVYKESGISPEFDHMIIFVKLKDGLYLCDVGFGSLFTEPKRLAENLIQLDYTKYYKFEKDPDNKWILRKSSNNSSFESVYTFEEKSREMIEFIPRCNFHQDSMDSYFKQEKLVTQLFKEGRITLKSRSLKIDFFGEETIKEILNEDAFLAQLEQHFGISSSSLLRQRFD
ncbi:MAG: arylamine N-acetyltransferase [Marinoscillum sp.]